jgi:autophagy-related protein 101
MLTMTLIGILHTIFFHRFFPSVLPHTREVLDLSLPYIQDVELETMIDQRATTLQHHLDAERSSAAHPRAGTSTPPYHSPAPSRPGPNPSSGVGAGAGTNGNGNGGRGQVSVRFFEKRRRKAWYSVRGGEDEVCWESWTIKVTVAEPRTESERAKVRRASESTLLAAVMKIVTCVNANKDHIPPITTSEANPFPYQISVGQKEAGGWWG